MLHSTFIWGIRSRGMTPSRPDGTLLVFDGCGVGWHPDKRATTVSRMNYEHHVLLTDYAWPDVEIERGVLADGGAELIVAQSGDEATLAAAAAASDVDAILTCWARVSAKVLAAAPRCRIVSRMGIGLDNIDLAECAQRGVAVANVPDYCRHEVAEHTIALLLALVRNVVRFDWQTQRGAYDLRSAPPMRRLAGQTLGVIGLGGIGREVARRALGLGMNVVACGRSRASPLPGVEWVGFERLLAASDFVSLHVPLNAQTRGIIGRAALSLMKSSSFLINTARGGLVDHAALADALARNALAGAALDVQDPEPPDLAQPPFCDERVIVTPHAAFASQESLCALRTRAARHVVDYLQTGRTDNLIDLAR